VTGIGAESLARLATFRRAIRWTLGRVVIVVDVHLLSAVSSLIDLDVMLRERSNFIVRIVSYTWMYLV
jgi:hypothetical protein